MHAHGRSSLRAEDGKENKLALASTHAWRLIPACVATFCTTYEPYTETGGFTIVNHLWWFSTLVMFVILSKHPDWRLPKIAGILQNYWCRNRYHRPEGTQSER
jgi:hypothetical protein